MKRFIRFAAILAALAVWPLAQIAHAGPSEPTVPEGLEVPAGNKLFLVGHAVGVQIYSCTATDTGFSWSFAGPRADLYDENDRLIATHFAGPTWQAKDGSYVVGSVEKRATPDATAIPWLRLVAASKAVGPDGDRLYGTTYIQRLATTGGLPPAPETCNADSAGTTQEISYTADYYFWKGI